MPKRCCNGVGMEFSRKYIAITGNDGVDGSNTENEKRKATSHRDRNKIK